MLVLSNVIVRVDVCLNVLAGSFKVSYPGVVLQSCLVLTLFLTKEEGTTFIFLFKDRQKCEIEGNEKRVIK